MQIEENSDVYKPCDMKYSKHICEMNLNYDKGSDEVKSDLENILKEIATKEGFLQYKIFAKNLIPDGNNFLGALTSITFKGTTQTDYKEVEIFVKSLIFGHEINNIIDTHAIFDLELFVYSDLSRVLSDLQDKAKIPFEERYKFVKFYEQSNHEYLIMEDMAKQQFTTWNRNNVISIEYAEKSIKMLAKFHALSFVLQAKRPSYFNERIKTIQYPVKFNDEWGKFGMNMANDAIEYMEGISRDRLQKYISTGFLDKVREYYVPDPNETSCLCHGDYKTGNILMRAIGGKMDIVPVDYQLVFYGSPITDITYFIFTTTDKEFRRKHLTHLKNLYYESMETFLNYFDIHIDDVYPREKYENIWKEKLVCGLNIAIWALPIMLANNEDVIDISATSIAEINCAKNDRVRVRLQEVVDDFIEWGYL